MTGKEKCKLLKQIRKEIAESNDIVYLTSECHYEGECAGTCPKCDAEIRYLDGEIKKKILAGEEVTLSGISLDSLIDDHYTKMDENIVDGELDDGPLMGIEAYVPENFLDMTIEEMDLSVRAYNCLKRSGRNTLKDILDTDLISMRKIRNLSMAPIYEIYFKIKSMGYELFEDEAYEDIDKIVTSSILGLAVGDALGVPAEFASREELENAPVEKMEGFGTYPFPEGTWSDDTSMSLATLDSLAYGIDYEDMMTKFCEWRYEDKYTPSGKCFDIGNTTEVALENYKNNNIRPLLCGCTDERSNGNGSLMRMIPVALYARYKMKEATIVDILEFVHNVSSLTHAHPRSKMACGIYVMILYCMIKFKTNLHISAIVKNTCEIYSQMPEFADEINYFSRICDSSFKDTSKDEIKSSGYVVDTLEAAIWCFENTDNFKDCVLKAVNLGEDTDTVAAVAGGLAGAYYKDVPTEFVDKLVNVDYIREFPDYTPQELLQIAKNTYDEKGYIICEETEKTLLTIFESAVKISGFGNGRFVRNLYEKSLENQATRLRKMSNPEIEDYRTILPEDISKDVPLNKKEEKHYSKVSRGKFENLDILFDVNEAIKNKGSLAKATDNAILFVKTDKGAGTAFLISPEGYALTCNHVSPENRRCSS